MIRLKVIDAFVQGGWISKSHPFVVELTQDEFEQLTAELHVTERYKPNDPLLGYEDRDTLLVPYNGIYIPVVWK